MDDRFEKSNISSPIKSVQELTNLKLNPCNCSSVPLKSITHPRTSQVLLCHDMAGGYKADALIGGSSGKNVYHCQYLHYIDIFCYFSHERITIPPRQWVESTHNQGVKCLGTIIVEWQQGEQEILKLIYGPQYNKDLESTQRDYSPFYADRLVEIVKYYGFDGYLFNVESRLPSATHCIALKRFLSYLKNSLHIAVPGSLLIWYDSVIYNGDLRWQDQLNEKNEMFFNVCDGIFTNYTWKVERLEKSAANAKERRHNVFTGIDVWGRNTFGGGGFNTHKALREIQKAGTSVAIFAPAWTFEHLASETFEENEKRFWIDTSLANEKFSIDVDDVGCVGDYLKPRVLCESFETDFCQGVGSGRYSSGRLVSEKPWNNLSTQNLQPSILETFSIDGPVPSAAKVEAGVDSTDAFDGGSCFKLTFDHPSLAITIGSFLWETSYEIGCRLQFDVVFKSRCRAGVAIEDANQKKVIIYLNEVEELENGWSKGSASLVATARICKMGIIMEACNHPSGASKIKIATFKVTVTHSNLA